MVDREAGPKAPKAARTQEANDDEEEDDITKRKQKKDTKTGESRPQVMTTTPTDKRVLRSASRRGK